MALHVVVWTSNILNVLHFRYPIHRQCVGRLCQITGVDLSKNPFAKQSNFPEAILELLLERKKEFKEYRDNNRRLINRLTPTVKVIQAFSGILGEAVTLVSNKYDLVTLINRFRQVPFPPAKALFVGIEVLISVRPSNTLLIHFLCDV